MKIGMKLLGLIVLITLSIAFLPQSGQCAKVAVIPMFGKSHVHVLNLMAQALIERGHDAQIVVEKTQMIPNMKTPIVSYEAEEPFKFGQVRDNLSFSTMLRKMIRLQKGHCSAVLNNTDIMNYLKTIDLLVTDRSVFCGSLIAMAIGKTHVVLSPGGINMPHALLGNPHPISYVPIGLSGYSSKMSFKQRFMNTIFYIAGDIFFSYISTVCVSALNYEFNINTSKSTYEIEMSPSMVLISGDFVLEYPRPLLPNVKVIGSIAAKPSKPLPNDLEAFMNGERKVVYIAFGTVIEELSQAKMKIFIDAINRLPYKVLWKSKSNSSNLGSHVKTIDWAPQNDILAHKNIIVFFSHCGHNSMYEAAYHGVPVLGMPVYGDQFDNMQQIQHAGFGVSVNFVKLTSDDIINGIAEVVKDRYQENAKRVSTALRSQRRHSRDIAVDWIEYVIANNGARHLRIEGYNLSLIQYYMLDVLLALIVIIILVVYAIKRLFQFIYLRCCKVKTD